MDWSLFERSGESCPENSSSKHWAVIRDAQRREGGRRVCVRVCTVCGSDRVPASYMYLNRKPKDEDVIAWLVRQHEYLEQLYKKKTSEGSQRDARLKISIAGMEILLWWFSDCQIVREESICTRSHPENTGERLWGQCVESQSRW